ncbi:MAG: histidine phosphatase family protein [Myxococcales bacterium]|nr:histidine phosphatase family protein [Myxococcales bacterium]
MQRQLIVMRHAKSSWKSSTLSDHDRPLNGRGRRDAPRIAEALVARDWWPDVVISSDSTRTRETWALMAAAAHGVEAPAVFFKSSLYLAGFNEVHAEAAGWRDEWRRVLVLGHNPGWQHLTGRLSGVFEEMTTANAALLSGAGRQWRNALEGPWQLDGILRPRELE